MKQYIPLFEEYDNSYNDKQNNLLFDVLFMQINQKIFIPITDELFDAICDDGYCEEVNNYEGDDDRTHYEYITLTIDDKFRDGLIQGDDSTLELFNDFDIALKNKYWSSGVGSYLDFIDYELGVIYIIRYKNINDK